MRFRVNEGAMVQRGVATYIGGEEFEATGDEAKDWDKDDRVVRTDTPTK